MTRQSHVHERNSKVSGSTTTQRRVASACLAALLLSAGTPLAAQAAEIAVLTAGAFKPVLLAVKPGFEQRSGDRLQIGGGTAGELTRQIAGGKPFAVLIAPQDTIRAQGAAVQPGSAAAIARVGIGVAVRQGAAVPDVGSVAGLRQALLDAPRIAMIDPANGSSGPAVLALFARLGIADAVHDRLVFKQGGAVAELVAEGQAALGLHQISEILPVPGVVLADPLPEEVQSYTTYAAAVGAHAEAPDAARALVAALQGPAAMAVIRSLGMEVAGPQ